MSRCNLPRPTLPSSCVGASREGAHRAHTHRCASHVVATMRLLSSLDHVAFVEDESSFEPIRSIAAGLHLGLGHPRMRHINTGCRYCHAARHHADGEAAAVRPGRVLSARLVGRSSRRAKPSHPPNADELRLIIRANSCSSRVYAALRRACAKRAIADSSGKCKLAAELPHELPAPL